MAYSVLIIAHAVAGLVAFAAGIPALLRERFLGTYRWAMAAMAGSVALAVAVAPTGRGVAGWAVAGGLGVLAAVMLVRAWAVRPGEGETLDRVNHVGFGLVGLFDAFWVVALLRGGLPVWAVVAVAVGIAVAGHVLLGRVAARLTAPVAS